MALKQVQNPAKVQISFGFIISFADHWGSIPVSPSSSLVLGTFYTLLPLRLQVKTGLLNKMMFSPLKMKSVLMIS